MAKNKTELVAEAADLGIDVDLLGEDGKEPTNEQIAAAIEAASAELPVSADLFLATEPAGTNVLLSSLLARNPDLRSAELKPSVWRTELDRESTTPTT